MTTQRTPSEFRGLDPSVIQKLERHNVRTTDDFVRRTKDPTERSALATRVGVGEDDLRQRGRRADLMRVPGVEPEHVDTLIAAGVDSVNNLRTQTPDVLARRVDQLAKERQLPGRAPHPTAYARWVDDARRLSTARKG